MDHRDRCRQENTWMRYNGNDGQDTCDKWKVAKTSLRKKVQNTYRLTAGCLDYSNHEIRPRDWEDNVIHCVQKQEDYLLEQ